VTDLEQTAEMQQFALAITATPLWINLPSGIAPLAGWRWFLDGDYVVFEPPTCSIDPRPMIFLDMHARTTDVEAVFRVSPKPGIYLRCKLAAEGTAS
jgi:hypothetical protein